MGGSCTKLTTAIKFSLRQTGYRPILRHILLPSNETRLALCCHRDMSLAGSSSLQFPGQAQKLISQPRAKAFKSEQNQNAYMLFKKFKPQCQAL